MEYSVEIKDFSLQKLKIQLKFTPKKEETVLYLANWRPGRYELTGYSDYISEIKINAEVGNIAKGDRGNNWIMQCVPGELVELSYEFIANKMDAGNSWVSREYMILNPVNFLIVPEHGYFERSSMKVVCPEEYHIESQLLNPLTGEWENGNYYDFVDSPVMISKKFKRLVHQVEGIHVESVFMGNVGTIPESYGVDIDKVIRCQKEVFGSFPEKYYKFLYYIPDYSFYHGVEHAKSTMIVIGSDADVFNSKYEHLLGIASHEFFHFWNACKIKPYEIQPYPLHEVVRFTTGWVLEGYTTYYGDLMLYKSGVYDLNWFFDQIKGWVKRHLANPVRSEITLSESSNLLWEWGYKRDIPPKVLSIYVEGALFALISDLTFALHEEKGISLDELMKRMWSEFGYSEKGYKEQDIRDIYSSYIGSDRTKELFDLYIHGKGNWLSGIEKLMKRFGVTLSVDNNTGNVDLDCFDNVKLTRWLTTVNP